MLSKSKNENQNKPLINIKQHQYFTAPKNTLFPPCPYRDSHSLTLQPQEPFHPQTMRRKTVAEVQRLRILTAEKNNRTNEKQ